MARAPVQDGRDPYRHLYLPFIRVEQFHGKARSILPRDVYGYFSSGATDEKSLKENQEAFGRLLLRWRCLRGVANVDLSTTVQGTSVSSPICVAPTAMQRTAHPDGEVAMGKSCAYSNTLMTLSTWATSSIEEVSDKAGGTSPRWFQLYVLKDRRITQRLVERAEKSGYKAIVLTIDLPRTGIRYADKRSGFKLPSHLVLANFLGLEEFATENDKRFATLSDFADSLFDISISWENLDWLKSITKLPIIAKGVMNAEDANEALRRGVSGIWVSNHGARQLDSTAATIEVLPEVVHAVNDRVEVYVDGGVRNGGDVLKALALGARAVFVGRPALWGLACNGEAGVSQVLELLNKELELSMALCGCPSVLDVPESIVVPAARYRSTL